MSKKVTAVFRLAQSPTGYNYMALQGTLHSNTTQDFTCDPVNNDNVVQDVTKALKAVDVVIDEPFEADSEKIAQVQDAINAVQHKWRDDVVGKIGG